MQKFTKTAVAVMLVVLCICFCCCDNNNVVINKKDVPSKKIVEGAELADTTYVKWEGRYEYKQKGTFDVAQVALYHTATGFTVTFYGTELKVRFIHTYQGSLASGTDIYYNVAVDDEVLPTVSAERTIKLADSETDKVVTVVSGLSMGKHSVTCLKMDEPSDAYTAVAKFETDGGFYLRNAVEDNAKTKFMIVCASNGSGFGSLYYCPSHTTSRTRANSSSLHGFMYLSARMFNADVQFVAQAGWGLACRANKKIADVLDYTGITDYNNVATAQKTALWDYSRWTPDVIVFHIGGNDTDSSDWDEATYKRVVVETVEKLHQKYPQAVMVWTHSKTKCGTYAIAALTAAGLLGTGNDYIAECEIPTILKEGNGYGAGSHASFYTHIEAAACIANTLEQKFGMERERSNVTFDDYRSVLKIEN